MAAGQTLKTLPADIMQTLHQSINIHTHIQLRFTVYIQSLLCRTQRTKENTGHSNETIQ